RDPVAARPDRARHRLPPRPGRGSDPTPRHRPEQRPAQRPCCRPGQHPRDLHPPTRLHGPRGPEGAPMTTPAPAPAAPRAPRDQALLVLEDCTILRGSAYGARGARLGEGVFTTAT